MTVLQFPQKHSSHDVRENVAKINEQIDDLVGLYWIAHTRDGKHRAGMAGSYRADPEKALVVVSGSLQQLHTYAARKRLEPSTVSIVI